MGDSVSPLPVIELFKLVLEIGKMNTTIYQFVIVVVTALIGWLVKDQSIKGLPAYIAIATLAVIGIGTAFVLCYNYAQINNLFAMIQAHAAVAGLNDTLKAEVLKFTQPIVPWNVVFLLVCTALLCGFIFRLKMN